MSKALLIRLLVCIFILGSFLYAYIDRHNDLTELKMAIPVLSSAVHVLEEENARLLLQVEEIENPARLLELLRQKEYSHLRYPYLNEVVTLYEEG